MIYLLATVFEYLKSNWYSDYHFWSFVDHGDHVVAFTSMLSSDTTVGGRAVVRYDHMVTNLGGAYQRTTGIFTAPYRGLYSFSCSLMSHSSNYVNLEMVKNGIPVFAIFSAAHTFPQSSQTIYLVLNQGDHIWMQNHNTFQAKLQTGYNVFSGIFIREM